MIITPTIKDTVLNYLCSTFRVEQHEMLDMKDILSDLNLDFDTFYAVMQYFQRIGFLEELGLNRRAVRLILLTEAHDFHLKGGFVIQEEIFKANIEKLGFEIDNLKKQLGPDKLDTLNTISSIASALFSGLALLPK